ncbi:MULTISPECIES: helix-turn-helix domain-containing protein [Brevibacterium]|uniref:HTH tetR-type domain-containing protein n=1 Tax=Brevibacterium salitolerans TaxID=1403566 RepID=A0ABN2WI74_9MICO|nr:TetR/AcrR family transcriptional regulator [Brevibacterium sp.]
METQAQGGQGGQRRGREAKDAILSAAIDCLLEDGYAATTTLRVQQRAGVSRGKLLHHFPSKRELLAAATRRLTEDRLAAVHLQEDAAGVGAEAGGGAVAEAPEGAAGGSGARGGSFGELAGAPAAEDRAARLAWMLDRLWSSFSEPNFWAAVETWVAARTDAELAGQIVDHERSVLRRVRANAHVLAGPQLSAHPRFPQVLDLLFTSMRGMALTYAFSGRPMDTEPMRATWLASARVLLDVEDDAED